MANAEHIEAKNNIKLKCRQSIINLKSSMDEYIEINDAKLDDNRVLLQHQSQDSIIDMCASNKELNNQTNVMQSTINNLKKIESELEIELEELLNENRNFSKVVKSLVSTYNKAFDFQQEILNINDKSYTLRIMFVFNGKLYANYYIDFLFDFNENLLDFQVNSLCVNVDKLMKWYSENKNVIQLIGKLRKLLKDYIVIKNL
ncbi:PREDICTED: uncharacterized protein LOC108561854 [Nicrophorus vespilloides]|uniref:Uncharacterized protein LOC108561854 n=1 Tax=Nicrophorus vespilloides TaxID=110193 RepID=A0ABM1MLI9_NICVS|nr:PREDICTED: uncharacterized protein LOC108561854 [Nicrophorus vespilloides]